jgi:DNA-binding ferritin-like protein
MLELICTLRASQLFLHHAHLLAKGSLFIQDHEFLSELYPELEGHFDSVSERLIGLGGEKQLDLQIVMSKVNEKLASCPSVGVSENKAFFQKQMEFEKIICSEVEKLCATNLPQGTKQMLGDIADKSEIRQYKIGRRIK